MMSTMMNNKRQTLIIIEAFEFFFLNRGKKIFFQYNQLIKTSLFNEFNSVGFVFCTALRILT